MSHLTQEQRYTIESLRNQSYTQKEIAKIINKDKSVVSRELSRNCDMRDGSYKSKLAQSKCDIRHVSKPKKYYFTVEVKFFVDKWLSEDYSPEQIVGYAKKIGVTCVSTERIYQYVWSDKKKGGSLYEHLRCQGKKYTSRATTNNKRGQIAGRVGIENRPEIVEKRERFGDLEIDLIIGKNHKQAILTTNDRATGLLRMAKVETKEANEIESVATTILSEFKPRLFTITSDNGKEFSNHINIAKFLEVSYYFAKPYHSWERGSNENLNGLIRQYFPKGTDFTLISDRRLKEIEDKLNNRPRKRFGFLTPNQVYELCLANNGKVAFIT